MRGGARTLLGDEARGGDSGADEGGAIDHGGTARGEGDGVQEVSHALEEGDGGRLGEGWEGSCSSARRRRGGGRQQSVACWEVLAVYHCAMRMHDAGGSPVHTAQAVLASGWPVAVAVQAVLSGGGGATRGTAPAAERARQAAMHSASVVREAICGRIDNFKVFRETCTWHLAWPFMHACGDTPTSSRSPAEG